MFGVKIRIFNVKKSIHVGFKLIHIQQCSFFGHVCQPFWISMICIILELHEFSDLKYPNFDPSHAFLSSIEAEITFLPKTAVFFF